MAPDPVPRQPRGKTRRETSNARLLRKRETDRLAQRATRERTKHRIEQLEQEIERLKSQDQNAVVRELIETTETQRKKNEELEGTLLKVLLLAGSACKSIQPSTRFQKLVDELVSSCNQGSSPEDDQALSATKCGIQQLNREETATFSSGIADSIDPSNITNDMTAETFNDMLSPPSETYAGSVAMHPQESSPDIYSTSEQLAFPLGVTGNTVTANQLPSPTAEGSRKSFPVPFNLFNIHEQGARTDQRLPLPNPRLSLPFLPLAADEEKWDVSNDAFLRALQSTVFIPSPDEVDPGVPFKAIFGGWHAVDAHEREKPIWQMLRLIDERVFGIWTSKIQKVALMYVTHALVKFRMNPIPENLEMIPTWLRSRPSQDGVIHPPVIDLLLWPGLRDRLVFEHPEYTKTGEFSAFYCNHLHFYWPFSEEEICTYNKYMRTFQISEKFKEYVFDLKNWTMDSHFLTRYPEFKHDITAYEDRMLFMSS